MASPHIQCITVSAKSSYRIWAAISQGVCQNCPN